MLMRHAIKGAANYMLMGAVLAEGAGINDMLIGSVFGGEMLITC